MLAVRENRGTYGIMAPTPSVSVFYWLACLARPPARCGDTCFCFTERVVEKLTAAILDLVELYCSTFNANFHTTPQSRCCTAPVQEAGLVNKVLSFNVYAAHRIPITWATR